MPITLFQKQVLLLLKSHRNPDSYVAGGIAIHRGEDSIRYSHDIDFFQESDEAVASASAADIESLKSNGYSVQALIMQPSFVRVVVTKNGESLRLEWVRDTAFRFFPVVEDQELGFRLHDIDLAINKIIALANRTEVRDVIDVLEIEEKTIGLAAGCWAACGKDPGFTPELLLEMISRHSVVNPQLLDAENLRHKLDPRELKLRVTQMLKKARTVVAKLNPADLGCLYTATSGQVLTDLEHEQPGVETLRHFGSLRGSWPRIVATK